MARFVYEGYDEVINRNTSRGRELAGRIDKALHLAAGCVIEALQREEAGTFKAPTGEMGRILAETPEYAHGSAAAEAVVYPGGNYVGIRGSPRRAATVAFVLENGRAGMPANPWNRRASAKSRKRVNEIVKEALQDDA